MSIIKYRSAEAILKRSSKLARGLAACTAGFLIILTFFLVATPVAAQDIGSVQLNLGSQLITGQLTNVEVGMSGNVSMTMVVNQQIQTQFGSLPMTATGLWVGAVNRTNVTGTIQDVAGTVKVCFLFMCGTSDFVGQGIWGGTLNDTEASGTFVGTITFTSSPFPQVELNKPQDVSGTWNVNLQPPSSQ